MGFKYYEDPILGKGRAQVTGGTGGGGGAEYVGGNRISIGGETISFVNSADIVNVTGTSVTLQPDTAYKIYATSQAITLNANPPAAGKWAYEGHLEIFTAGTGYIVTGSNVVLANALEPDSVNNCTVRFHDGIAIIAVEDHVAGYIVVNGSTAGEGSLYYGITTSTNDYVAFDASLTGQTIPLAGAVAEGEKHIVGNGYTETTLTGNIDCDANKVTVANLALSDVGITGGTLTLGDAYIPSGSTVAVSGGILAVEKVTGEGSGSLINLGGAMVVIPSGSTASATGVEFTSGNCNLRVESGATVELTSCNLTSGTSSYGAALYVAAGGTARLTGCALQDATTQNAVYIIGGAIYMSDCSCTVSFTLRNAAVVTLVGDNTLNFISSFNGSLTQSNATVTISSGASIALTRNINFGGNITVLEGGCTVNGHPIAANTYTSIASDGTTVPPQE
jgi:hypothetical protein